MMSLDYSIVRKIYGTFIPLEERVCVVGEGGGTLTIIPRCVPDAFYRVRTLDGIWGLSPMYGVRGEACGKKIGLGHSKELK